MHPNGFKPDLGVGHVYINGVEYVGEGISDYSFEEHEEAAREYCRSCWVVKRYAQNSLEFTMKIKRIPYLKVLGLWDWAYENCPNGRVKHLMRYGKNDKIRHKNYQRALGIICKSLVEVKEK